MRFIASTVLVSLFGLGLVACGGGDDTDTQTKTGTSEPMPSGDKPVIASAEDMPTIEYDAPASPSALILDGAEGLDDLREQALADINSLLNDYVIEDRGTRKELLSNKRLLLSAAGRYDEALALNEEIRELEDKPALKELSGVSGTAWIRTRMDVGAPDSEGFEEAFEANLREGYSDVDVSIARDELEQRRGQMSFYTPALIEGVLRSQMDTMIANAGDKMSLDDVVGLVGLDEALDQLEYKDTMIAVLDETLARAPAEEMMDLWSDRLVTLDGGEPVVVAVWDSGVDPAINEGRMWTGPNGENGIYFDIDSNRSDNPLYEEAADYADELDGMMDEMKGVMDLQAGIQSDEANSFVAMMSEMEADEVYDFSKRLAVLGNYVHGTHVADISVDGAPSARIMNVRISFEAEPVPTAFDEEDARKSVAAGKEIVDFMKENDVRVVNMSWGLDLPSIESGLAASGEETDPERRRERAREIFSIIDTGLTDAMASAPDILFVAAAGNSDESVEFARALPAGINLDNVMTVGAVDIELQSANFTSYGESIDVYANGFEVPGRVPGGRTLNLSGTSMAAPQVTNLAAKLFASDPDLTVAEVRDIIESTATIEGEENLKVIHPVNALAELR